MKSHTLLSLIGLSPLFSGVLHAQPQQPGVDCAPIEGQGWSGCAPLNPPQQQGQQQAPQPPPQRWQDHWGAIATDTPKGVLGATTNMLSQNQAEQAALIDCQTKGGAQCKIQISYRNQCAAMVIGGTAYNTNAGSTLDDAIRSGIKTCNTLKILIVTSTTPLAACPSEFSKD